MFTGYLSLDMKIQYSSLLKEKKHQIITTHLSKPNNNTQILMHDKNILENEGIFIEKEVNSE